MTNPTQAQIEAAKESPLQIPASLLPDLLRTWARNNHVPPALAFDLKRSADALDRLAALTAAAEVGEREYKDGDPLVTELIWEVDRAVKQAMRENGRYDTVIHHILNRHLAATTEVDKKKVVFQSMPDGSTTVIETAAAEVGEPLSKLIDETRALQKRVEAVTIERCARVAEGCTANGEAIAKGIAARIRALKDQP